MNEREIVQLAEDLRVLEEKNETDFNYILNLIEKKLDK